MAIKAGGARPRARSGGAKLRNRGGGPKGQQGGLRAKMAENRQARQAGGPQGCKDGKCGGGAGEGGGGAGEAGGGGGGGGGIGEAISSIAGAVSSIAGAAGGGGGEEAAAAAQGDQIDPATLAMLNGIGGVNPMQAGLIQGGTDQFTNNMLAAYGMQ